MSIIGYYKIKYLREEIDDWAQYLKDKLTNDQAFLDEAAKKPYCNIEKAKRCLALQHDMITKFHTHFVTFNFNYDRENPLSAADAEKLITRWHRKTDREVYGKHFNKLRPAQRTSFIGFFENVDSNIHVHVFLTTPDIEGFDSCAKHIWKGEEGKWDGVVPGGQFYAYSKVFRVSDKICIARYITKQFMRGDNSDNFILSQIGGKAQKRGFPSHFKRRNK